MAKRNRSARNYQAPVDKMVLKYVTSSSLILVNEARYQNRNRRVFGAEKIR
jgi:hypothetical protein